MTETKHQERKDKQFNRLKRLYLVYRCFEHYKTAILHSESASTYQDTDYTFIKHLSDIFGVEFKQEDMLDEDELCDIAIVEYKLYEGFTDMLDDETKNVIKSFCEYVIKDKEYTFINGTGFLIMGDFIKDIMKWRNGILHIDELKMYYTTNRDFSFYRKEIIRTERIINDLINFNKKNFANK